jgi:hypothetical protein
MGNVKSWAMDLDEKCWDEVADVIAECENVGEAYVKATEIFAQSGMYVDMELFAQIEEGVDAMWEEYWAKYNM